MHAAVTYGHMDMPPIPTLILYPYSTEIIGDIYMPVMGSQVQYVTSENANAKRTVKRFENVSQHYRFGRNWSTKQFPRTAPTCPLPIHRDRRGLRAGI